MKTIEILRKNLENKQEFLQNLKEKIIEITKKSAEME